MRPPDWRSRPSVVLAYVVRAHAQNYPNRPIRVIVPFAAGGAVDVLARLVGASCPTAGPAGDRREPAGRRRQDRLGLVAKSPPDGYTMLQNTNGAAIAPALYKTLPFDAEQGLRAGHPTRRVQLMLVASPKSGITSM